MYAVRLDALLTCCR